jgi:hypothetical protein
MNGAKRSRASPHTERAVGALQAGVDGQQRLAPEVLAHKSLGCADDATVALRHEPAVGVGVDQVRQTLPPPAGGGGLADVELECIGRHRCH